MGYNKSKELTQYEIDRNKEEAQKPSWFVSVKERAKKYTNDYINASPLYKQAKAEYWDFDLIRVVENMAFIQAQAVTWGEWKFSHSFGYDNFNLAINPLDYKGATAKAWRIFRAAKERNKIIVHLTDDEIDYLKYHSINKDNHLSSVIESALIEQQGRPESEIQEFIGGVV